MKIKNNYELVSQILKESVQFGTPFAGLKNERQLTKEELIRAIRFSIAAEFEAIQLYMQLAESITDKLSIKVLKDIADEERVHVGELLKVLKTLDPNEAKLYEKGEKEVEKEIDK